MISRKDVEKLASLARLSLSDMEKEKLQKDMESILGYVSELQKAPAHKGESKDYYVKNVMRKDEEVNKPGQFTEKIMAEAPKKSKGYFVVKKILGN